MILRSRKIQARQPKEPRTPKRVADTSPNTPRSGARGHRRVQPKTPSVLTESVRDGMMTLSSRKRTPRQTPSRRTHQEEEDLETPLRERSVRVRFQTDTSYPGKPALVSSIYTPGICFLSPRAAGTDCCSSPACKEGRKASTSDCPYFSHIPPDESSDAFNPYEFICNVPLLSCDQWQHKKEIPFKTRSAPERTLVLDLDDTLVHSSLLPHADADFTFLVPFQDTYFKVYLMLRPHVGEFLEALCKVYEIFVFTTAKKEYAEKILEILDPQKKLIRHRLFQEDCVCVAGHYVKDLRILQRDLTKTITLDSVPLTIPYNVSNRIPVQSWTGDRKDQELLCLIPALEKMTNVALPSSPTALASPGLFSNCILHLPG
ncbi:CTD small phosphatase-like protein 2 [Ascaphus truei]|uniref:CTD small phosphatase-like protein 2 n=1 Tax=Ascaphus truei TaxID=8439 RepID=UPI003F59EBA5